MNQCPGSCSASHSSTGQCKAQGPIPGTTIYMAPAPQQYTVTRLSRRLYDSYHSKQSQHIGATMIVGGIYYFALYSIISVTHGIRYPIGYTGFLDGIWLMLNGSFGFCAAKQKTQCKIVAFMILSMLSTIGYSFGLLLSILKISYFMSQQFSCERVIFTFTIGDHLPRGTCATVIALELVNLAVVIIQLVAATWGSIICCKVVCCGRAGSGQEGQVITQPEFIQMTGAQQVVVYNPTPHPEQTGQSSQYPGICPSAPIYSVDDAPPSYEEAKRALLWLPVLLMFYTELSID